MNRDRQTIFSLVAAGRITAAEAERLLAASAGEREIAWIAAVCALACAAPLHWNLAAFTHGAQAAIIAAAHTLHDIVMFAQQQIGGRP